MLELKDLYFSVGDRNIIDGINYTFEKGKFYGITGPNGSGKTTLAKLIMGINTPNAGEIRFGGKEISQWPITERAREGIAYSFQQPARFKGITFRDLLAMAAGTDDEDMLLALLRRVGICSLSFLDKPVDAKLSGGEIKKIELATTIARNPRLAIYDEPDTGIDLWTIQPMVRLLKREQKEHGTTTIVVSHNRAFLEAADIVLMINEGKLAYRGDLQGALPMLNDLSACNYRKCVGDRDVGCYR
ncbi:MAG TPA: ABC transporter ATP-binding protein [Syntrophales bacterium]|mgnify:CR=1 FL=1|nr:ABC transporter ATP-binding protein [Syntrophales bacterium]HOD99268.1 ABC transporter ATP-binding protein [Syntrophales bacterium]HOH73703.1 ABC transporter ATP-binding protein [Syntrophales bacterium]HPN07754.1 ABC transporter ATP-binding protein [Syntrophales bacterium]HPX82656.1 ABC transporter ATP-binding protein [Syntrophales bacterium]